MGQILINGVNYSGSNLPPSANNIEYSNERSGLEATNVQDAIDELKASGGDAIVSLTQAEYEQIEDRETNGKYYFITDVNNFGELKADGWIKIGVLNGSQYGQELDIPSSAKELYVICSYDNGTYVALTSQIINTDLLVDTASYFDSGDTAKLFNRVKCTKTKISSNEIIGTNSGALYNNPNANIHVYYRENPNASGSKSQINYSTEEQDTGLTWIDGNKLYQKTIELIGLQSEQVHNNVVDGDIVLIKDGYFENQTGYRFPISTNWGNGNQSTYIISKDNSVLTRVNNGTYKAIITIQYTKTTD